MFSEFKKIIKDEGLLLFCIVMPFVYPLLYSWIYTNEVVRDVPMCVIDNSKSALSRELIRDIDASPNVEVTKFCTDLNEARSLLAQQKAYGVLLIPQDFSTRISRLEQSPVSLYCDMSFMLNYKAIFQTVNSISMKHGSDIQVKLAGNKTDREDDLLRSSIKIEEVQAFNTTGGYGNFILPGVLVLIIQQTLLLGMGMRAGTNYSKRGHYEPESIKFHITIYLIYFIISAYMLFIVPAIFSFTQQIRLLDFFILVIPMLIAFIAFGNLLGLIFRNREDVMVYLVFTSIILLFFVGMSWPEQKLPALWKTVAWVFPSTPAARAYIRLNTMGSELHLVMHYIYILLVQTVCYIALWWGIRRIMKK